MKPSKIYIIAGEASGDFLGAAILKKLKELDFDISIIGGELMKAQGLKSLFDISEISVGGIVEIIPHIRKIKRLIKKSAQDILLKNPDILLTIDSPGFNFRIAKIVRKLNKEIKLIHFVAPSVWAWREKRAKKIAKIYDMLLTLFDFEPPYFEKYGLNTIFVGHPAIEYFSPMPAEKEDFILLMPGSREQEIKALLPIFLQSVENRPEKIIIPTIPGVVELIRTILGNRQIEIETSEDKKRELYQKAKFAIVASGTAVLQLALSNCPMVVCYKLSSVTYNILKYLVNTKYVSLVNIILNKQSVPELIQNNCTAENIILNINPIHFSKQISDFSELKKRLMNKNDLPTSAILKSILTLSRS
ncbi:MAG: lipid-A-disaccharide synthase [Holosporales bacterium]|jgi:lipid-A-disaccharide synthase|nr:lipid-A-disaccharide synthase [Holosporales bacterium]